MPYRDESEVVIHANDHFAQVAYLRFKRLRLEDKTEDEINTAWMSDMNLSPVWAADAILTPIEDIVKYKQLSREKECNSRDHGRSTTAKLVPLYQNNKQANDSVINQSKFMTHHSDVVCAIGGTTAYISFPDMKKDMSIAEETMSCLVNVQGILLVHASRALQ
jgi:diphthine-ammonia ligase